MATVLSNGTIYTTGLISASDLNDIANYYRSFSNYSVNFSAPNTGATATAGDFNNLRQAIINGANPYWKTDNIPGSVSTGWEISSTTWGPPVTAFVPFTNTYYQGVGTIVIPPGCYNILVDTLLGGGGTGGNSLSNSQIANDNANVGPGGGGGSGGCYQNTTVSVTPGDTVTITVGKGGWQNGGLPTPPDAYSVNNWYDPNIGMNGFQASSSGNSTDALKWYVDFNGYGASTPTQDEVGANLQSIYCGGSSTITGDNNSTILEATGGHMGGNGDGAYWDQGYSQDFINEWWTPGAGGAGGTPNGVTGGNANGRAGGQGANSPMGTGGDGGIANGSLDYDGKGASGYGAGGGGGYQQNTGDHKGDTGGYGTPGYAQLTFEA